MMVQSFASGAHAQFVPIKGNERVTESVRVYFTAFNLAQWLS